MNKTETKLAPEQKKALDLMLSGKNVFLTGKAWPCCPSRAAGISK